MGQPVKLVCLECGADVWMDSDAAIDVDVSCLADFDCFCAEDDDELDLKDDELDLKED